MDSVVEQIKIRFPNGLTWVVDAKQYDIVQNGNKLDAKRKVKTKKAQRITEPILT